MKKSSSNKGGAFTNTLDPQLIHCLFTREWLPFGGVLFGDPTHPNLCKKEIITFSKGKVPVGPLGPSKVNLENGRGAEREREKGEKEGRGPGS